MHARKEGNHRSIDTCRRSSIFIFEEISHVSSSQVRLGWDGTGNRIECRHTPSGQLCCPYPKVGAEQDVHECFRGVLDPEANVEDTQNLVGQKLLLVAKI
jgi:hypothetical protein